VQRLGAIFSSFHLFFQICDQKVDLVFRSFSTRTKLPLSKIFPVGRSEGSVGCMEDGGEQKCEKKAAGSL